MVNAFHSNPQEGSMQVFQCGLQGMCQS